ncbi:acyl-CoA thioesterase domain-containing protein [Nocardia elegans]|uniref:acyl-CoA thioesterase domain-containing protein n=1 Tax=Nocardia elegans TaxID=300029 RepID=UPI002B4B6057|nr:acyl-CoA thioesterase domain-containing protein [Nocardia elegans]
MSISLSDSVGAEQAPAERSDLDVLLGLLELDEVEPDVFIGHHPEKVWSRTFGGQLVAQAIMAAGRTVGDRPVHAVNAHFVRGGDPKKPIEYRVVRHRDGRAFANRTVTAVQDDQELFVMLAAFQDWGKGLEHAHALPEVPDPETLPRVEESFQGLEDKLEMFVKAPRPIDMRYTNDPAWILKGTGERLNHNRVWMRADGALPDDPLVHVATLGYSSDTTVLDSILTTHGLSWGLDRIVAPTFLGFALLNSFTFGVDLVLLTLFRSGFGWPVPLSFTVAYVCAFSLAFVLNRTLNFHSHAPVGRQLVVYVVVVVVNYLAFILGVGSGLAAAGLDYHLARLVAGGCEAIYMYSAMRWIVFRR